MNGERLIGERGGMRGERGGTDRLRNAVAFLKEVLSEGANVQGKRLLGGLGPS